MAARKPNPQTLPPATIAPREYAPGTGWREGDIAPSDAYRRLDSRGCTTGPVVYENPGGRAIRIAVKGMRVGEAVRREFDRAEREAAAAGDGGEG